MSIISIYFYVLVLNFLELILLLQFSITPVPLLLVCLTAQSFCTEAQLWRSYNFSHNLWRSESVFVTFITSSPIFSPACLKTFMRRYFCSKLTRAIFSVKSCLQLIFKPVVYTFGVATNLGHTFCEDGAN